MTETLLLPEFTVDDADVLFLKFLDLAGYLAKLTTTTIDDQAVTALVASERLRRWALEMLLNLFHQEAPVDRLPAMQVPDDVQLALTTSGLPLSAIFDLLIKYGPTLITFFGPLLKKKS